MTKNTTIASIIMAAGRGSRMKGYSGNKSLLPLIPGETPFEGQRPFIHNILDNLPQGPKCIIVHHAKDRVVEATKPFGVIYCEQEILNGTGGALLASLSFLRQIDSDTIIITMGDVPLVKKPTFFKLIERLKTHHMAVLGFVPDSKRQYGVLELRGDTVVRIIEWKYWKDMPREQLKKLSVCNSGIYAVRRADLLEHLAELALRPHEVQKQINGTEKTISEYFITDLVEIFIRSRKTVGYEVVNDPDEVMGVDDLTALVKVQKLYSKAK